MMRSVAGRCCRTGLAALPYVYSLVHEYSSVNSRKTPLHRASPQLTHNSPKSENLHAHLRPPRRPWQPGATLHPEAHLCPRGKVGEGPLCRHCNAHATTARIRALVHVDVAVARQHLRDGRPVCRSGAPRPWLRRRRRRRRGPVRGRGRTLGRCGRRRRRCACRAAGSRRVPAVPVSARAVLLHRPPGSHGRGRVASLLLLLLLLPLNRLLIAPAAAAFAATAGISRCGSGQAADGAATNAAVVADGAAAAADALRGDFRGVAVFRCLLLGCSSGSNTE